MCTYITCTLIGNGWHRNDQNVLVAQGMCVLCLAAMCRHRGETCGNYMQWDIVIDVDPKWENRPSSTCPAGGAMSCESSVLLKHLFVSTLSLCISFGPKHELVSLSTGIPRMDTCAWNRRRVVPCMGQPWGTRVWGDLAWLVLRNAPARATANGMGPPHLVKVSQRSNCKRSVKLQLQLALLSLPSLLLRPNHCYF